MKLKIAIGPNIKKTSRIKNKEVTVSKLFRMCEHPDIRANKDGEYFVLADFGPNKIRNKSNVVAYHGAVIDLDDTPLSIADVQELFKAWKYCIYTTHNHQDLDTEKGKQCGDRFRLVLPYKEPLSVADHALTMLHIMDTLGMDNVDTSTNTISRGMYFPSRRPPSKHQTGEFKSIKRASGKLYRLELTPDVRFELAELQGQLQEDKPKVDINEKLHEGQGRNDAAASLVGSFINSGMEVSLIFQSMTTWNEVNCNPPLGEKELKTTIDSIVNGHEKRGGDWGVAEILERIKKTTQPEKDFIILTKMIAVTKGLAAPERMLLIRTLAKRAGMTIGDTKDAVKSAQLTDDAEIETDEKQRKELSLPALRKQFKDYVFIETRDQVYNKVKQLSMKPEAFNRAHASTVEKGSMLPLLLKYNGIQQVDIKEYHPGEDELYFNGNIRCVNSYNPPQLFSAPGKGGVKPMLRHLKKLMPNEQDYFTMLDFITYLVQHPGKKMKWMLVLKGTHGIGKSIVVNDVISQILGVQNVKLVESKKIKADFNAWQLDTQLICFHELKTEGATRQGRLDMTDCLKDMITEPTLTASYKGVDDYQVDNRVNVIGFTNHEDAILIVPSERRFYMIRSEMKPQPPGYYRKLTKWLREHKEEMLYFFETRQLSPGFDAHHAATNAYTLEVKEQSHLWPGSILVQGKDEQFFTDGVTTWDTIARYVYSQSVGKDLGRAETAMKASSSEGHKLTNTIKDMGFRRIDKPNTSPPQPERIRVGGKLQTLYLAPDSEIDTKNLGNIRRIIKAQKNIYDFNEEK